MGTAEPRVQPRTIDLSGNPPLGVHGEALVQPELAPGGVGDQVAKPAVGDLVDDDVHQGAIPGQQAGRDEGDAGVLHPTEGEGGRHEQHVVPGEGRQLGTDSPLPDAMAPFPAPRNGARPTCPTHRAQRASRPQPGTPRSPHRTLSWQPQSGRARPRLGSCRDQESSEQAWGVGCDTWPCGAAQ